MLEEIRNGNEAWILEDNPPRLNSEELEAFRTKLSEMSIQCSDGNVSCEISLINIYTSFCLYTITSKLINKASDLELDLDLVEADAMDDSDEIMDDQNFRQEDAHDYGGIGIDVGGAEPQDEWDPINFY
jgi:hypothetical protein